MPRDTFPLRGCYECRYDNLELFVQRVAWCCLRIVANRACTIRTANIASELGADLLL